jgi:hypothetical protein
VAGFFGTRKESGGLVQQIQCIEMMRDN